MARPGEIRTGKAYVELGADDSKLIQGLKRAQAKLRAFGAAVQGIGLRMMALGAAGLAPLVKATLDFSNAGDTLDKMSKRTGLSAEALSELGFAAEQSGANLEAVETSVRRMQKTLTDAADGTKAAADAFAALGLSVGDLAGLSPEQQFERIAGRLNGILDPTRKAALAMEIFGRSGTALLPMLGDMEALRQQARDLGLTVSTETAAKAAVLNDVLNIMRRTVKDVAFEIGASLADSMIRVSAIVTDAARRAAAWIAEHQQVIVTAAKVAVGVVAAGGALIGLGIGAQLAAFTLGGVAKTLVIAQTATRGFLGGVSALTAGIRTGLVGAISLVPAAIKAIPLAFKGLFGLLNPIRLLGLAFKVVASAILAVVSPVGIAVVALGVLTAGIAGLVIQQFKARDSFSISWNGIAAAAKKGTDAIVAGWQRVKKFCEPVVRAVSVVALEAFEKMAAIVGPAMAVVQEAVGKAWDVIGDRFGRGLVWLRSAVIGGLAAVGFAFKEWQEIGAAAVVGLALRVVRFGAQMEHLFMETIPTLLKYFVENWKNVFKEVGRYLETVFTDLAYNISNFFSAMANAMKGKGWSYSWRKLGDDFGEWSLPALKLPKRQIGQLEKELADEFGALTRDLGEKWEEYRKQFEAKIGGAPGAAPTGSGIFAAPGGTAGSAKAPGGPKLHPPGPVLPSSLQAIWNTLMKDTTESVGRMSTMGTFNPFALRGIGDRSTEKIIDNTGKIVHNTERIERAIERNQLLFL